MVRRYSSFSTVSISGSGSDSGEGDLSSCLGILVGFVAGESFSPSLLAARSWAAGVSSPVSLEARSWGAGVLVGGDLVAVAVVVVVGDIFFLVVLSFWGDFLQKVWSFLEGFTYSCFLMSCWNMHPLP